MHEYSIATSLLGMVEREAAPHPEARVLRVHLRIGAQAGVEVDLLRTAWENVRRDGRCAAAELVIAQPPVRWVCALCARPVPEGGPLRCPDCDVAARLEGGDELLLERVELELAT